MVKRRGFTLLEIMVVLTVIALIAGLAASTHRNRVRKARETVLRHNLAQIRLTLDAYNTDKGHYPESLGVLVDESYLRSMPEDPMTTRSDTWVEVLLDTIDDEDSSYEPGVFDVKSGSDQTALDGTEYREW